MPWFSLSSGLCCGGAPARRACLTGDAGNLWILGGIFAVLGVRLYWLVVSGNSAGLSLRQWFGGSGTTSWGAYVGVVLAVGTYAAVRRLPAWPWLDLLATLQPLGEAIGRWACVLAGDDFGRVTHLPWAIHFPRGSFAWTAQVAAGQLPATADSSLPVHPEQFYLMVNALVLFFVISAVWRRSRNRAGLTFAIYLVTYGATRFCWEFFRDPAAGGAASGLSSSQWMCAAYVTAGCGLLALPRGRGVIAPA